MDPALVARCRAYRGTGPSASTCRARRRPTCRRPADRAFLRANSWRQQAAGLARASSSLLQRVQPLGRAALVRIGAQFAGGDQRFVAGEHAGHCSRGCIASNFGRSGSKTSHAGGILARRRTLSVRARSRIVERAGLQDRQRRRTGQGRRWCRAARRNCRRNGASRHAASVADHWCRSSAPRAMPSWLVAHADDRRVAGAGRLLAILARSTAQVNMLGPL